LTEPDLTKVVEGPVPVNGNGTYTAPTPVLATQVGTYTWTASYDGDAQNKGAVDDGQNESLKTVKASPAIATQASETAGGVVGTSVLSDSATITGLYNFPTRRSSDLPPEPDLTIVVEAPVPVNGNGTYTPPTTVPATQVGT